MSNKTALYNAAQFQIAASGCYDTARWYLHVFDRTRSGFIDSKTAAIEMRQRAAEYATIARLIVGTDRFGD